jgi:tetratricopeptide (TPR) repeat protein
VAIATRRQTIEQAFGLALAVALSLHASDAFSAPIDARARADFTAGRWRQAANFASRLHDADNLAFAARALLASALLSASSNNRTADIVQARQFAEAALIVDPRHIEGRLQLATALGLQARLGSPTRAFAAGLPQRVRRLLNSVLRDAPNQAWTYALLGGWHLEGLRIGGKAAQTMLGADIAQGKAAFANAMRLEPTQAATPFYFAASLLALNPAGNAREARALLVQAQNAPVVDAFQGAVKTRAGLLIGALDSGGPDFGARLALGWL